MNSWHDTPTICPECHKALCKCGETTTDWHIETKLGAFKNVAAWNMITEQRMADGEVVYTVRYKYVS